VRAYRERFVPSDVVAMAVVGEVKTDVMIFDKGVLRLCYSANAGLPEETESGEWVTPLPEERDPFSAPPQLFSELSHCFRFFQNQFPGSAVGRVLVVADHPKADLMVSHLGTQLQVPVELGKPAYELHLPMEVDERAAAVTRALSLAEFRGAALNVLSEGAPFLPINLLPTIRGARILTKPALTAVLVLMPLALLLALAWSVSLGSRIKSQNAEMDRTQAKIAALQPELDMLRAAQATEQALRNGVERETARIARERTVRWSQILVDISDRLPGGMWLTQSNSPDTTKITLTGIATSREIIPRAIESLAESPYLANVRLGSLEKDDNYAPGREVVRYQIKSGLRRGMMIAPEQTAQPVMPQEETSQ
jgi:Tfp pilus assembly protein PilN